MHPLLITNKYQFIITYNPTILATRKLCSGHSKFQINMHRSVKDTIFRKSVFMYHAFKIFLPCRPIITAWNSVIHIKIESYFKSFFRHYCQSSKNVLFINLRKVNRKYMLHFFYNKGSRIKYRSGAWKQWLTTKHRYLFHRRTKCYFR